VPARATNLARTTYLALSQTLALATGFARSTAAALVTAAALAALQPRSMQHAGNFNFFLFREQCRHLQGPLEQTDIHIINSYPSKV